MLKGAETLNSKREWFAMTQKDQLHLEKCLQKVINHSM